MSICVVLLVSTFFVACVPADTTTPPPIQHTVTIISHPGVTVIVEGNNQQINSGDKVDRYTVLHITASTDVKCGIASAPILIVVTFDVTIVAELIMDHTWGEWSIKEDATCSSTGIKHIECKECGYIHFNDIPKNDSHNLIQKTQPFTCTEEGKIYYYCIDCGYTKIYQVLPAKCECVYDLSNSEKIIDFLKGFLTVAEYYYNFVIAEKTTNIGHLKAILHNNIPGNIEVTITLVEDVLIITLQNL